MRRNLTANSFVFGRKYRENAPRTFLSSCQGENFQNASELNSKPLRFWTHKSRNCAQNFFHKPFKRRTFRMRLNFTASSFVFKYINRENAPRTFFINLARCNLRKCVWTHQQTASFLDPKIGKCTQNFVYKACMEKTSKMRLNSAANSFAFGRKNREDASTFFINLARQRTSKMSLSFSANSFVFGCTNCGIAPRTFSVKLTGRELPKCVWTNTSYLDANILKMRPELFFELARWKPPKCVWASLQRASFLHAKVLKMCPKHFCKLWRQITQKMHLNFTANSFALRRKNLATAPRTSL